MQSNQTSLITQKKPIPFKLKVLCKINIFYVEIISSLQKLEEILKSYPDICDDVKKFRREYEKVEYHLTAKNAHYKDMNCEFFKIYESNPELAKKFKKDFTKVIFSLEHLLILSTANTLSSEELKILKVPSEDSVITIIRANIKSLISEYQLILDTQTAEEQLEKHQEIIVALSELNNLVENGFLLNPEFYNLLDKIIQDIGSFEKAFSKDTDINRKSNINFFKAIKEELKKSQNQDLASDIAKAQKLVADLMPLTVKKQNIEEQIQELEKKINKLENRNEGFPSYIREAKEKALSNITKPTWAGNIKKEKALAKSRRSSDKVQAPECRIFER